ncbi:MAG: CRISPR-associated endonuclease Cas1 [Robiginitomaculum sp.]|nr:CRISPR-associated endonuclease Cas1 [Robiginitomaculum sp.]
MLEPQLKSESTPIVDDWAERSQFWLGTYTDSLPRRKRREREPSPLVLTGQGLSMRVDKGALVIRDGNTHYPAQVREWRFFKGALDLPPRIIVIDGSGNITLDAIDWMGEQSIPLIRLRWDGHVTSIMHGTGYAADPKKVAWQLETRTDEAARIRFAIPLITRKIKETLITLQECFPSSLARNKAVVAAHDVLNELETRTPATASDLLGLEGRSARAYFRCWRSLAINWKGLNQHPIPDEWLGYSTRSTVRQRKSPENRRATHPINAMLNYAYGMLEGQTRIKIITQGYDPTKGILHGEKYNDRHTFVFDQMEPARPLVDRSILALIKDNTFSPSDFTINAAGTCRLNPELARVVVRCVNNAELQG